MIDPVILDYYDRTPEETRLGEGAFRLEEARTRELIRRFAPRPPGVVLDVGGAAGPYALWLADSAARPLASCEAGDARALAAPDRTADLVLLLGPLYHLTEAHHRKQALREAARKLGRARLGDATIFTTLEPCAMCVGALLESDVEALVFAVPNRIDGAAGTIIQVAQDDRLPRRIRVVSGIRRDEAEELLAGTPSTA